MDLLRILFTISLILFPFGQILRFRMFTSVSLTAVDISVGLLVVVYLIKKLKKHERLRIGKIEKAVILFIGFCILSLSVQITQLSSSEFFVASLYLLRWVSYFFVYLIVKEMKNNEKKRFFHFSIVSGAVFVIIGIFQYFFYNNLGNLGYLEWDNHLYRLFGSFLDPNFTGVFLVLYLLLLLSQLKASKRKKKMIGLLAVLTIFSIIVTYSRTALLMLFVAMLVLIVFSQYKKGLLFLVGFAVLLAFIFSDVKVEGMNPFRSASTLERIKSLQNAVAIIQKNPLLGVGFNAYRYAQHRYGFRESSKWMISHADAGTDNSFLFVFATTGIVGLISYLYLWYEILTLLKRKSNEDYFSKIVFVSCVGLLVSSLFLNTLFYPFLLFFMWMILGLTENR